MKKFLIAVAVAALAVAGSFAQDALSDATSEAKAAVDAAREEVPQSLQGTWYDKKYDCNWVLSVNASATGLAKLVDASTGHVYYTFTKNNVQNFKQEYDMTNGAVITFDCAAKNRSYKFVKPITATADLNIDIYHRGYEERHQATIAFRGAEAK